MGYAHIRVRINQSINQLSIWYMYKVRTGQTATSSALPSAFS
jgi:hypothetical protein